MHLQRARKDRAGKDGGRRLEVFGHQLGGRGRGGECLFHLKNLTFGFQRLDMPWLQVDLHLSPPRYVRSLVSRRGFGVPAARRVSSILANARSRSFGYGNKFQKIVLWK